MAPGGEERSLDFLIKDACVLPLAPDSPREISCGYLGIRAEKIACLGEGPPSGWGAREEIDARGMLVMPGLVNTHTHAAMTLLRGFADDLPLQRWLEDYIFPAEARVVTPETVYWGSLLACAEMIRSGTTTFADGYFCLEGSVRAADEAGMRAVLAHGIVDFPAPGIPQASENLRTVQRFLEKWSGFSSRLRLGVFPHTAYTCSEETLRKAWALSREWEVPLFIHLAETRDEVQRVQGISETSPVRFLHRLGLLEPETVAVHAVHIDREELEILKNTGTRISHCPESNMKLGSGTAPLADMIARGLHVGLGTDGCASNNDLDLFREMGTAARLQKVMRLDPVVLEASTLVRLATSGGAAVLGWGDEIGSLEVGKQADMILLDLNRPHLTPLYDPFSHLVHAACGADVDTVFIAGRMVMRRRRLLTLDWEEVRERVKIICSGVS